MKFFSGAAPNRALIVSLLVASQANLAPAITIDATDPASVKAGAKQIATEMMGYYVGDQPGQTPGYLPGDGQPGGYYWWVGGGMFATMVNYWYHTGDATWNDQTAQAIYFQSDPSSGGFFDSKNVSLQLGNDDQAFWAFAAMSAAEYKFPNPPSDYPSWLAMAQGVFNQQAQRWDPTTCGGGIRWQVFSFADGYDYKNSITNGCFFNLAARLGKYTGNTTYIDQAIKMWDWASTHGLVNTSNWVVVDGIVVSDCNDYGHIDRWTYNVGVFLYGAAVMWNISSQTDNPAYAKYYSQAADWEARVNGLINGSEIFFKNNAQGQGVLTEVICEPENDCQVDGSTFKAYLARWMRVTAQVAPFSAAQITALLEPSIDAAATACSGAPLNAGNGVACGQQWYTGNYDGRNGIGMQMNALEVIATVLDTPGPLTHATGGDSVSDPSAGAFPVGQLGGTIDNAAIDVTTGDKAGAAILTILFGLATVAGGWWIVK